MPLDDDHCPESRTVRRLRGTIALFTLLLVGSTWPLWQAGGEYPQIPWLAVAIAWPGWVDRIGLGAVAVLLVAAFLPGRLTSRRMVRMVLWGLSAGPLALLLLDQQRLQPWVWQLGATAVLLACTDRRRGLACVRGLVISIYAWSAVSKLDAAFLTERGPWFLEGLLGSVGLSPPDHAARLLWAGWLFPLGELAVAALLLVPRTRRWGVVAAMLMHVLLLLTLGPLGHRQKPGVLLWNVYFLVQAVLLFGPASQRTEHAATGLPPRPTSLWATALATALIVAPALEPLGLWDHWPGWSVYSARPAMVPVSVHESRMNDLPESLRPHIGPPAPLSEWRPVHLDSWSLAERDCPIYPQLRYRLAVVRALAERGELGEDIRVAILGPPDRWSGRRSRQELDSAHAIEEACDLFWVNTQPRARSP